MSAAIFNQGLFHAFSVGPFDGTLYELWGNPPTNSNPIPGTEPSPAGYTRGRFDPEAALDIARIVYDPANPYFSAYFVTGRGLDQHGDQMHDPVIALWDGSGWTVFP
jgi:hypothetical protein